MAQGSMGRWTCPVVSSGWETLGGAQGSPKLFHLSSASCKSSLVLCMLCHTRPSCSITAKVKSVEGHT